MLFEWSIKREKCHDRGWTAKVTFLRDAREEENEKGSCLGSERVAKLLLLLVGVSWWWPSKHEKDSGWWPWKTRRKTDYCPKKTVHQKGLLSRFRRGSLSPCDAHLKKKSVDLNLIKNPPMIPPKVFLGINFKKFVIQNYFLISNSPWLYVYIVTQ